MLWRIRRCSFARHLPAEGQSVEAHQQPYGRVQSEAPGHAPRGHRPLPPRRPLDALMIRYSLRWCSVVRRGRARSQRADPRFPARLKAEVLISSDEGRPRHHPAGAARDAAGARGLAAGARGTVGPDRRRPMPAGGLRPGRGADPCAVQILARCRSLDGAGGPSDHSARVGRPRLEPRLGRIRRVSGEVKLAPGIHALPLAGQSAAVT